MSQFGRLAIFDHPFLSFPLVDEGATLRLPCGTIPTVLVEREVRGEVEAEMRIMMAGSTPLIFHVALSADEVQQIFAEGMAKLNRVSKLEEAKPFPKA